MSKFPVPLHIAYHRGFTLIETFVAISVLLVAVSGALSLASRGLAAAAVARDEVTAYYLSQEAIEYVRYVRDSNSLVGVNWLNNLDQCIGSHCTIDAKLTTPATAIALCGSTCSVISLDAATGFYGYTGGTPTIFTRDISIQKLTDDEVIVSVSVSWKSGAIVQSFAVKEYLYNWR
jgi:prepilin-type N-terminal cleavage/methylation domain-containing protein